MDNQTTEFTLESSGTPNTSLVAVDQGDNFTTVVSELVSTLANIPTTVATSLRTREMMNETVVPDTVELTTTMVHITSIAEMNLTTPGLRSNPRLNV